MTNTAGLIKKWTNKKGVTCELMIASEQGIDASDKYVVVTEFGSILSVSSITRGLSAGASCDDWCEYSRDKVALTSLIAEYEAEDDSDAYRAEPRGAWVAMWIHPRESGYVDTWHINQLLKRYHEFGEHFAMTEAEAIAEAGESPKPIINDAGGSEEFTLKVFNLEAYHRHTDGNWYKI